MELTSDITLFEQAKAGDESAFEAIFKNYYEDLCRYANKIIQDLESSEEIVQDLFCTLWDKKNHILLSTSLKSYLFRAVFNSCMKHIRHLKVRQVHQKEVLHTTNEGQEDGKFEEFELELKIEKIIEQLPEQCRKIFKLSRFENKKYQEIADELGISVKTVEAQVSKALKILREELKEYLVILLFIIYYYLN